MIADFDIFMIIFAIPLLIGAYLFGRHQGTIATAKQSNEDMVRLIDKIDKGLQRTL